MVFVGDILLGDAGTVALQVNGYEWPFEKVRSLLEGADLIIGNLEGPMTSSKEKLLEGKGYSYKCSPEGAPALKRAGFHAVSLANNHTLDYGIPGLRDTITVLRENRIAPFGAGENEAEARRGVVYDFGSIRIGVLGYTEDRDQYKALGWFAAGPKPGCAMLSLENLESDIARMRKHADAIVVSVHWGATYKDVKEFQEETGRRAIDLGADMVCGHHPHIAQGIEIYRGKPIVYSLGNFAFCTNGRYPKGEQGYGLVSRWLFEGKTLKWLLATPIAVNNKQVKFQPRRVQAEEARRALAPRFEKYQTGVRWNDDTAFIGFAPDWETATLPAAGKME